MKKINRNHVVWIVLIACAVIQFSYMAYRNKQILSGEFDPNEQRARAVFDLHLQEGRKPSEMSVPERLERLEKK